MVMMEDYRRPASFRYCYANASKISLLNGELTIIFGIQEDPSDLSKLFEEIGVVMTPEAAKLLADTLHQTLKHKEIEPDCSEIENSISLAIDAKLNSDTPGS
jgi:hypothetical protein